MPRIVGLSNSFRDSTNSSGQFVSGAEICYFEGDQRHGSAYLDELDGLLGRGIHFGDLDSRSVLRLEDRWDMDVVDEECIRGIVKSW